MDSKQYDISFGYFGDFGDTAQNQTVSTSIAVEDICASVEQMSNDLANISAVQQQLSFRRQMKVDKIRRYQNFWGTFDYPMCPRCGTTLEREYQVYCDRCGQHLDWSEIDVAEIILTIK